MNNRHSQTHESALISVYHLKFIAVGALIMTLLTLPLIVRPQTNQTSQSQTSSNTISIANIVDLTHTLTPQFPYIPVPGITFAFGKTPIATVDQNGVAAFEWKIHEHLGTQIDAPSHFFENGKSLEQMPVASLIAPLAVIDISERAKKDADATVTVEDILAWEKRHGHLPEGAAVFMYSGWDAKIGSAKDFINLDASNTMHFPGFSPEAAAFLVRERNVAGIGVDTISLDPGKDKQYKAHKTWLASGKWGVECVANLSQIPPAGATVFVGAVKVGGATGGPVRLIATFSQDVKLASTNRKNGEIPISAQIIGNWKSPVSENIGNNIYTLREFRMTKDRWEIEALFYADQNLKRPLFSYVAGGDYHLGEPSATVSGATNAVFNFDKKSLNLLTSDPAVINQFGLGQCGLTKGTPKDISKTGCSFFPSIDKCSREYDLVSFDGYNLRLGARPADRNMCVEEKRPKSLGLPVVRQN